MSDASRVAGLIVLDGHAPPAVQTVESWQAARRQKNEGGDAKGEGGATSKPQGGSPQCPFRRPLSRQLGPRAKGKLDPPNPAARRSGALKCAPRAQSSHERRLEIACSRASLELPRLKSRRAGASERGSGNIRTEERQETVYALRQKRLEPSRSTLVRVAVR
jgi:hypothetical protein